MKRFFTAIIALFSIGWLAAQIVVRTETGVYFLPTASVDSISFTSHQKHYEYFSVGADKYVIFSPGNLQCSGVKSGNYRWSFAAHQYDCIGAANVDNGALADKIDLFGWSTTNTATPWGISISNDDADYSGDFVDWGKNVIGQYAADTWRTLSREEWEYLFNSRTDASSKYGVARINLNADGSEYMNGLIILPDSWTCPSGITFKSGVADSYGGQYYADYQTFTLYQWQQLENAGAVFLPAAGCRGGTSVYYVQYNGRYWSSTAYGTGSAYYVYFDSNSLRPQDSYRRYYGSVVRLVQDLYTITCNPPIYGSLSADKAVSLKGGKVTITVNPDEGYTVRSLTVLQGTTEIATTISGVDTYTFTMPAGDVVVSAVYQASKYYSVSATKKVLFASGNLQYQASTDTWSFAAHQYDCIGAANVDNGALADKIDLFGWSTTNTATPWGISTSTTTSDYSGDFVDWGKNIGDGNIWRTLSGEEWEYLFNGRANASSLYGYAKVNDVKGIILLPDDWVLPSGITFTAGGTDYSKNSYTLEQWETMESACAVFLPVTGNRNGTVVGATSSGYYWSGTESGISNACIIFFNSTQLNPKSSSYRYVGRSVRLVLDLQRYKITCNPPTHGSLSTDKTLCYQSGKVTITAIPEEGYTLQSLTVLQGTKEISTTFSGSNTYTFTMPAGDVVVSAVFQKIRYSVSDNEDVAFSKGNLQYTQSTKTWSFAEHQYDYIGAGNVENGVLADKIDLFGWSADNTTAPWGISTSTNKSDYSGDFVDWGENVIGGYPANTWRTLSGEEWGYLFESRTNASSLYGFATVDGKKGLILLPDDWVLPSGISFHAARLGNNVYTLLQWEEMELAGAVFLPGASRRKGTDYDVQGYNVYWSSTTCNANNENDPYNANFVLFHSNNGNQVEPRYCDIRYYGRSVRLVKDL